MRSFRSYHFLAYQVMSNHNEPQTIWFDNSQLKALPLNSSTGDSDVILIDDDDSDDDFNENSNGGLTHEPSDNSGEQKVYSCSICHSKLSSSYNLKRYVTSNSMKLNEMYLIVVLNYNFRHYMIHTGEKPFKCEICERRFREQSDLRKHKKVHENNGTALKCSVCNRNQPSSRHSRKCISCEKQEAAKLFENTISEDILPRIDANNKKSFVCKYCDRAFGSSSNLKRHVMIHTGEKPFKCNDCGRPFREMSTLKKHLITHRKQNGFTSGSSACKPPALMDMKQQASILPSKSSPLPLGSLHKCPLCKTICRGTESLMTHITSVHRPNNTKMNGSSNVTTRKQSKSPPPLIPINKAVFKHLNAKRV